MVLLIKGGEVYSPDPLGLKDILIAGEKIIAVAEKNSLKLYGLEVQEIDASDKYVLPALIDPHVHLLGGGGEGGPTTRAPEIRLEDIVSAGVTTVIGCLGTDSITRHLTSLLAKARALEEEGLSTFILSGAYDVPVVTLTGSIRSDLVLIDKVVGAGEVAISDHRSSQPRFEELARLAAECRVGGLLGGKAGILHLHVGEGTRRLELIWRLLAETEIPVSQIIPTHVNRNQALLEEAFAFALKGGTIDLTALPTEQLIHKNVSIEEAITQAKQKGVLLERITISSDANGSLPVFDDQGNFCGLTVAKPKSLWSAFCSLLRQHIVSLPEAVRLFATNAAVSYKLAGKGLIKPGYSADLIIVDHNLGLYAVISRGQLMVHQGQLRVKSRFVTD